ncbi:Gfo/Idh/MocA family protein [Pelagicoccus mobilis]|uniref:Gfo/Idh/MocA family oxidoreductase n=1 Tax=Pelagicoccus mobilis TaxID=415221 RepID=A0A934RUU9_9BACT|nr:Gfo/Idh/MocA family oxidoreductase [Pelagicoccus mobilis]MBK1878080.1 Gfo/Idh/MocA family oxidoreductase [Pelagicoccus mobilis]
MNRRTFINKSSAAGLAAAAIAPTILPSTLFGANAPSKKVTLGVIGLGPQGMKSNLAGMLRHPKAQVVAVCDCKLSLAHEAKIMVDKEYGNQDCKVYQDFRDIISRKDIDAVVISTPDHWHVPMSMMALDAGKDVFCEKPSLTITEGRDLVEHATKLGKVFQWGIEDRSFIKYWMLAGIARTGAIGKIHSVECCQPYKPLYDKEAPGPIPADLDWNLWLGPAPWVEHTPRITERQRWRQNTDYSGGSLTDWGSHLCDTAQIAIGMENIGPSEILGTSNQLPDTSYVNTPSGYDVLYRYSNDATIRVRDTAKRISIRIEGTEGWVECKKWNGELAASDMNLFRNKELGNHPDYWPRPDREQKEFIDAVISRGQTSYNAEAGHRLATTLHLGHIAIRSGETIHWDPKTESFTKDAAEHKASIIYQRESRDWEKSS